MRQTEPMADGVGTESRSGEAVPGIDPEAPWLRAHAVPVPFRPDPRCVTCTPPDADPDVVAFTDHWKIVLHPDQTAAGACLLGSRRHVARVGELTTDEAAVLELRPHILDMAVQPYPLLIGADLIRVDRYLLYDAGFVDAGPLEEFRHLRTKTRLIGGRDLR